MVGRPTLAEPRQGVPSSLWQAGSRHVGIARNDAIWEGFPDVTLTASGKLLVVYKEGDGHGIVDCRWSKLCVIESTDLGKTWTNRQVISDEGWIERSDDEGKTWRPQKVGRENLPGRGRMVNCPKISALGNGSLIVHGPVSHWQGQGRRSVVEFWKSDDDGATWKHLPVELDAGVTSKIVALGEGRLVFVSHPGKVFESTDAAESWTQIASLPAGGWTGLGEIGLCQLADGRLAAVIGDRKYIGWPAHLTTSSDGGKTWAPLRQIGIPAHSPCTIRLRDGRVCVTYRVGSGTPGCKAWIGKLDDLPRFAVHAERWFDQGTRIDAEGLHIENDGAEHQYTQYHLYPPENANCPLAVEVEVKVLSNAGCAASLCIGSSAWVEFYPDHIHLAHRPEMREDVAPDRFHVYRFQRVAEGRLNVSIDGKHRTSWSNVDRATQPWLCFGNRMDVERLAPKYNAVYPTYAQRLRRYLPHHVSPTNTGHSVWRRLGVRWDCPNMGKYEYTWAAQKDGFPDRWYMENTLELARSIQNPHTSMNGCVELPDGRLFAVYYFADGAPVSCPTLNNGQPDRGHSCYVRGTFFSAEDFGRGFITDSGATQSWPEAELAEPKVVGQGDYKPG